MSYFTYDRWGASEREPSEARMAELLGMLDIDDGEHPSVSLTHESEWSLGAYPGGLVVWEHLESDERPSGRVCRDSQLVHQPGSLVGLGGQPLEHRLEGRAVAGAIAR